MSKIKLKFEAESGEDLRKQMLDFLGQSAGLRASQLQEISERVKTATIDSKVESSTPETPTVDNSTATDSPEVEKTTTRKRRTKAELEAEKAASEQTNTPVDEISETADDKQDEVVAETVSPSETSEPAITKEILTPIVIAKGREGKRAAVVELFKEYGCESLPTLDPSHYVDFHSKIILL